MCWLLQKEGKREEGEGEEMTLFVGAYHVLDGVVSPDPSRGTLRGVIGSRVEIEWSLEGDGEGGQVFEGVRLTSHGSAWGRRNSRRGHVCKHNQVGQERPCLGGAERVGCGIRHEKGTKGRKQGRAYNGKTSGRDGSARDDGRHKKGKKRGREAVRTRWEGRQQRSRGFVLGRWADRKGWRTGGDGVTIKKTENRKEKSRREKGVCVCA